MSVKSMSIQLPTYFSLLNLDSYISPFFKMVLPPSSFFLGSILLGLAVLSSPSIQDSRLDPHVTKDQVEAARTRSVALKPVANMGKIMMTVLSMTTVGYAVSISLTNNHPLDLTDPHWYIVDGKLDTPPPDVLQSQQTMVITFERNPSFIKGAFGTKGFLTYKMGTSFLVVFWSSMPAYTNRLMVKIVDQDPNAAMKADSQSVYEQYFAKAWEIGDLGKWFVGVNKKINCKFVTSMGNGRKAPLEIFLSPS